MAKSIEEKAVDIIKRIEYINLSTVTEDGHAWGSPVYTAFDKELNFYWLSWKENQHSLNIHNNPDTFVTIYDSTVPCGTGLGVYMQGKSKKLTNPDEVAKSLVTFFKRQNKDPRNVKHFLSKYPRRIYKFTPEKIWVNGTSEIDGNFIDVRTELSLEGLTSLLR